MIKAVVFDLDGVVINKPEVFSVRFARKHGIPMEEMLKFFKIEFQLCLVGKADLKVELAKYLQKWGVNEQVEEVLKFWFEGEKEVDDRVVEWILRLSEKGVRTCLATNNEKYRVNYLLADGGLARNFDFVVTSAEAGTKKPERDFFEYVLKKLLVEDPNEVMFWDDDKKNVQGAEEYGMIANLYIDLEKFNEEMLRVWV